MTRGGMGTTRGPRNAGLALMCLAAYPNSNHDDHLVEQGRHAYARSFGGRRHAPLLYP